MTERVVLLGVLDDSSGQFGVTATEVLRQCSGSVQTFIVGASKEAWRADVIVAGTTGVRVIDFKESAERIREVRGTLPNTIVVFATQSVSSEVVQTAVNAGAISAVTFDALPRTIGNLVSSCVFTSTSVTANTVSTFVEHAHDPESGRLDGKRVAELFGVPLATVANAVGVTPSALSKRSTARSAQDGLRELTFVWRTLLNVFGAEARARAWLNAARSDLDGKPPLALLANGTANDLGNYVRRALAGEAA